MVKEKEPYTVVEGPQADPVRGDYYSCLIKKWDWNGDNGIPTFAWDFRWIRIYPADQTQGGRCVLYYNNDDSKPIEEWKYLVVDYAHRNATLNRGKNDIIQVWGTTYDPKKVTATGCAAAGGAAAPQAVGRACIGGVICTD